MALNAPRLYPQPCIYTIPPYITIPHEVMLDLIQWFTTRALMIQPAIPVDAVAGIIAQDERMVLDWFNLLVEPYLALQVASPQLSGLKRDIHGLRTLLTVLFEQSLGTRARKEAASMQIFAGMPVVTAVLLQYYGEGNIRAEEAMLYDDLINWVRVALKV